MVAKRMSPSAAVPGSRPVRPVRGVKATGVREELAEVQELGALRAWLRHRLNDVPSWLASMVVHMILLVVLAWLTLPSARVDKAPTLLAEYESIEPALDELLTEPVDFTSDDLDETNLDQLVTVSKIQEQAAAADPGPAWLPQNTLAADEFGTGLPSDIWGPVGGGDDGPGGDGELGDYRTTGINRRRGTPEYRAVALALQWLAEHQLPDGGWSFNHCLAPGCGGQCRNTGTMAEARVAATGLALLPFLGAGQTHTQGKYSDTVRAGLYFLGNRIKLDAHGGSFFEPGGRMYSHGIASIALCEAYALTFDRDLRVPAQSSLNFICYAQDPIGGGWRYMPRERGDTSVVGWQIMALKSGHMAYLVVPPQTVARASAYLDGVQSESGARYGYTDPGRGSPATTAIGLLCRMYLGWKKDEPALVRGVDWLSQQGPSTNDMYYNYYATQVMRHFGGEPWKKWDAVMKPQLVDSQATVGHEKGSWHFSNSHGDKGGRLYSTAMAAMTLEVYYRHMPIYKEQSIEEDFPVGQSVPDQHSSPPVGLSRTDNPESETDSAT